MARKKGNSASGAALAVRSPARALAHCILWGGIAATLYWSLLATPPVAALSIAGPLSPYLLHFGAFGVLALAALTLWSPGGKILAMLAAAGGVIEILQAAVPSRQTSLADFAASTAGILGAAMCFVLAEKLWASLAAHCNSARRRRSSRTVPPLLTRLCAGQRARC